MRRITSKYITLQTVYGFAINTTSQLHLYIYKQKQHNKMRGQKCKPAKDDEGDDVQLFKSHFAVGDIREGRPKRIRFKAAETKLSADGEGFLCPECSYTCPFDSKHCENCRSPCSYMAGIGVVVSKESNVPQVSDSDSEDGPAKKTKRSTTKTAAKKTSYKKTKKLSGNMFKKSIVGPRRKKRGNAEYRKALSGAGITKKRKTIEQSDDEEDDVSCSASLKRTAGVPGRGKSPRLGARKLLSIKMGNGQQDDDADNFDCNRSSESAIQIGDYKAMADGLGILFRNQTESEINSLKEELNDVKSRLNRSGDELSRKTKQNGALRGLVNKQANQIHVLHAISGDLRGKKHRLEIDNQTLKNKLASTRAEKKSAKAENRELQAQNQDLIQNIRAKDAQIRDMTRYLAHLQAYQPMWGSY